MSVVGAIRVWIVASVLCPHLHCVGGGFKIKAKND